ncbi:MAG: diadenylate cyclase, partial [Rikenellaceae bacterium]
FLISRFYKIIKGTSAFYIVLSIASIYVIWALAKLLNMTLLSTILGQVLGVGLIALIVVFQQEVRRFLVHIGNKYLSKNFSRKLSNLSDNNKYIDEIVSSCQSMSESYTGALIVLGKSSDLNYIVETGDAIESDIHRLMIESIFYKNAPLHDGAMIIIGNKIKAVRCVLPSTEMLGVPAYYGMRHKAAIGLTEKSDATVVVVSEQTGKISYVIGGKIHRGITPIQLKEFLMNENK